MTSLTLFAAPYVATSGTSQEGAEKAVNAPTQAALVLGYLKDCGVYGATDEHVATQFPDIRESDLRRARVGLRDIGLVDVKRLPDAHKGACPSTGKRGYCSDCIVTEKSSHGVRVAVWYAVEFLKSS